MNGKDIHINGEYAKLYFKDSAEPKAEKKSLNPLNMYMPETVSEYFDNIEIKTPKPQERKEIKQPPKYEEPGMWETIKTYAKGAYEGITEWDRKQTARIVNAWSNSDIGALARGDFKTFWEVEKNSSAAELLKGNFKEAAQKFGEENRNLSTALGFETAKDGYREAYKRIEDAVDDGDDTKLSTAEKAVAVVGGVGDFADEILTPVGLASLPVFNGLIKGGNWVLGKLPSFFGKAASVGLVADGSRRVGNGVYDIAVADTKEEVKEGTGKVIGGTIEAGIGVSVAQNTLAAEALKAKTPELDSLRAKLKSDPNTKGLEKLIKGDKATKESLTQIKREVSRIYHPDTATGNTELMAEYNNLISAAEKNLPKADTSSGLTQKVKDGFSNLKDKVKGMFDKKPHVQDGALVKTEASITPKVDTPITPVKAVVTPKETVIKPSETTSTMAVEPKNTTSVENQFKKPYSEAVAANTATVLKDVKPAAPVKEAKVNNAAPKGNSEIAIDGVTIRTNGTYTKEVGQNVEALIKKWADENPNFYRRPIDDILKTIPNFDYANLETHLKNIKTVMSCVSNSPKKAFENGYFSSPEGAKAFEILSKKYSAKASAGMVSPISIPLTEYKPQTILAAQKRNLLGGLKNTSRIMKLTEMSDDEFASFMQRAQQSIKDSGYSFEELKGQLLEKAGSIIRSEYDLSRLEDFISVETVTYQIELVDYLKNYPRKIDSLYLLSSTDISNIGAKKEVLDALRLSENTSAYSIGTFAKAANSETKDTILELLKAKDIPVDIIRRVYQTIDSSLPKDAVIEAFNNNSLIKTMRAVKNGDFDITPVGEKPTKLNPDSIESSALALVHMTNYEPEGGRILSTRDKIGGSRNSVHFTLNHPVESHRYGDWDESKIAVIMPYEAAVKENVKGKFIEGMPNDIYTDGSVDIPQGSVIVKINQEIKKGTVKVSEYPSKEGVTLIETSENPHDIIPAVLEKMGYSYQQAGGNIGGFMYGKNGGKSVGAELRSIKAWQEFCKKNGITPAIHSYSVNGVAEALIERLDALSVNGSWYDRKVDMNDNYKTKLLKDIETIKKMQSKGYFVSYDLDKLCEIVKRSSTPQKAKMEVKKAFGFGPSVERDYFSSCSGIFTAAESMPETVEALESDEKLLKHLQNLYENSFEDY